MFEFCMGGANRTNPVSDEVPITLKGQRDHFRHLQSTRVFGFVFFLSFFFWLHPFPMCSSIVFVEQIGESFLRNNIAFTYIVILLELSVLSQSGSCFRLVHFGCPRPPCLRRYCESQRLLRAKLSPGSRRRGIFVFIFLQKVCKKSIVQQFSDNNS